MTETRDDTIRRLVLNERLSDKAISTRLGITRSCVTKRRTRMGLPAIHLTVPRTLEQAWEARVQPVDGGHLIWTSSLGADGLPDLWWRRKSYEPTRIAFRIRTGRDPQGSARRNCDTPLCVAPEHVDDTAERQRVREQFRYLTGMGARPTACKGGHDQAVDGRLEANGTAYCTGCQREAQQHTRQAGAA
jgi:hypothetical protein